MENNETNNDQMKSLEEISSAVETMSQRVSNAHIGAAASRMGQKVLHKDRMCNKEIM